MISSTAAVLESNQLGRIQPGTTTRRRACSTRNAAIAAGRRCWAYARSASVSRHLVWRSATPGASATRGRAVTQTAAGLPDPLNGRFRLPRWARIDPKKPAAIFLSIVSSGHEAAVHKTPQENGVRDQRSVARANRLRNKIAIERLHPIVAKGDCRPVAAIPCFHPPVKKQAFVE